MTAPAALFAFALAQMTWPGGMTDPRIRVVPYNAGQVVTLPVGAGYAAVVEFSPDERVDSVVVGNSAAWQVTASKRGDSVVVKPLGGASPTDMIVITGERRYVFLLQPGSAGDGSPFVMRFAYPQPAPAQLQASTAATFRFRGAKALFPVTMRDDGQRTTIRWSGDRTLPAIFAVDGKGHETLVNGRAVGADYVIEGISARYIFRSSKARAVAVRRVGGAGK